MAEEGVIRINFERPMPLYPLSAVVLFPHGVVPLHISDDRYRQMVDDVLDNFGQIALAVYKDSDASEQEERTPAVRPVVCIGQILQHQRLPDGKFNIALQGLCRAKIQHELPPEMGQLYRQALLEPIGLVPSDESGLRDSREWFGRMLADDPLADLRDAEAVLEHLNNPDVPTSAILELMTLSFIGDNSVRYQLLSMIDARQRATLIQSELESIAKVLRRAKPQRSVSWPKGCSWN
ncbi:MAG: LON peptidase substrate-binding domain-containing protein [Pyrinomonadaceae bacterium]|nr:LON peptidase substrate-binding domain-containing protein [Phycisphaerales bacterium]